MAAGNRPSRSLSPLKRGVIAVSRAVLRAIGPLPVTEWLHSRLWATLRYSRPRVALARGGPGLDGLTIAFLVDLHAGPFMGEAQLTRIFAGVAALEPDLVCLGGDLVEDEPEEILLYRRPLRRLAPPLGIFAVPGNHEYHGESTERGCRAFLEARGVHVLRNRGRVVTRRGSRLWIAGVDDLVRGTPDLDAALEGRRPDDPVLLLAHRPDSFHEASGRGVDLTLSGHTHGGQILLFGWTPFKHTRYGFWRGAYERDGARLYVSRGAGVTTIPLRIGAPAEVPVITLTCRSGTRARGGTGDRPASI